MTNPWLEQGLAASASAYDLSSAALQGAGDAESVSVSVTSLRRMKKCAAKMNRCITRLGAESAEREDRLWIELHLLHQAIVQESVDVEANTARVTELFRKLRFDSDRPDREQAQTSLTANPLTALSTSSKAMDTALNAASRIRASINELDPEGDTHTHGASLIAAKRDVDRTT